MGHYLGFPDLPPRELSPEQTREPHSNRFGAVVLMACGHCFVLYMASEKEKLQGFNTQQSMSGTFILIHNQILQNPLELHKT